MKELSKKEFQYRQEREFWGKEIAGRVIKVKRRRKNLIFSLATAGFAVSISAFGFYQNSANSTLATSANIHFESIFTQEVDFQSFVSVLDE